MRTVQCHLRCCNEWLQWLCIFKQAQAKHLYQHFWYFLHREDCYKNDGLKAESFCALAFKGVPLCWCKQWWLKSWGHNSLCEATSLSFVCAFNCHKIFFQDCGCTNLSLMLLDACRGHHYYSLNRQFNVLSILMGHRHWKQTLNRCSAATQIHPETAQDRAGDGSVFWVIPSGRWAHRNSRAQGEQPS